MLSKSVITIISYICLLFMGFLLIHNISSLFRKNRRQRLTAIRQYKKGAFTFIFLPGLILFLIGNLYSGQSLLYSCFDAIKSTMNMVVFDFQMDRISKLMEVSEIYRIAVNTCFILVFINAVEFFLSIFSQSVFEMGSLLSMYISRKGGVVVFGKDDNCKSIIKSSKDNKEFDFSLLVSNMSKDEKVNCYFDKYSYMDIEYFLSCFERKIHKRRLPTGRIYIVVNTGNNELNLKIQGRLSQLINSNDVENGKVITYVFGGNDEESVYKDIEKASQGLIMLINKYKIIAYDFIKNHPYTKYLGKYLDTSTALLDSECNVNSIHIGFGDTNRTLFLYTYANSVYLKNINGNIEPYYPEYHIFDINRADECKNLNHNLFRYYHFVGEKSLNRDDYLPLPSVPSINTHIPIDVNSGDFYVHLKETVKKSNSISFITIAYSSDLKNIDLARKIREKLDEWAVEAIIFVHIRDSNLKHLLDSISDCYAIGCESETVFSIDGIVRKRGLELALCFSSRYSQIKKGEGKLYNAYFKDQVWFNLSDHIKQESALFQSLNLRTKLNLIGYDYVPVEEECNSIPCYEFRNKYPVMPKKTEITERIAIQEHYRWNLFMISNGFIPASMSQIMLNDNNGKDYKLRTHGNITTFDGLVEFNQLVHSKNPDSAYFDIRDYDYSPLSDGPKYLEDIGFKIVPNV